ncbi:hypothetical protein F8388_008751 [Cannabis sativa]|uniref:Uncharacterized protein n=1 Tax=Cannabis sativa TaxID=3483 RepID=A0A7J6E090_CANSA|nr:hypothetical protein F8388_008751 [Cannabis sativa]
MSPSQKDSKANLFQLPNSQTSTNPPPLQSSNENPRRRENHRQIQVQAQLHSPSGSFEGGPGGTFGSQTVCRSADSLEVAVLTIEAEDSRRDGKRVIEEALKAMSHAFDGKLFVLSLGKRDGFGGILVMGGASCITKDIKKLILIQCRYSNEKSSFHVLTRIDKFRMILAKMEAYDNSMVHSRSLGSRRILPPPPPTKNRQSAMRAPAPPPLVAY